MKNKPQDMVYHEYHGDIYSYVIKAMTAMMAANIRNG